MILLYCLNEYLVLTLIFPTTCSPAVLQCSPTLLAADVLGLGTEEESEVHIGHVSFADLAHARNSLSKLDWPPS